jgi:hypothetical protein
MFSPSLAAHADQSPRSGYRGSDLVPWVAADLGRCFQLMQADDVTLLQRWAAEWSDLIAFEIVPVVAGKDTAAALAGLL